MPQYLERRPLSPQDICSPQNFGSFVETLPTHTKGKIIKADKSPDAEKGTSKYTVIFRLNSREGQLLTIQYVPLQLLRSRSFRGGDYSDEHHDGIFFDMHLCTIETLPRIDTKIALSVAHATSDVVSQWWKRRNDSYVYVQVDKHVELRLGLEVFRDVTLSYLFKLIGMYVSEYEPLKSHCQAYLQNRVFTIKQLKK